MSWTFPWRIVGRAANCHAQISIHYQSAPFFEAPALIMAHLSTEEALMQEVESARLAIALFEERPEETVVFMRGFHKRKQERLVSALVELTLLRSTPEQVADAMDMAELLFEETGS